MTRWLRKRERGYVTTLATLLVLTGFYAAVSQFLPPAPGESAQPSRTLLLAGLAIGLLGAAALVTRHWRRDRTAGRGPATPGRA